MSIQFLIFIFGPWKLNIVAVKWNTSQFWENVCQNELKATLFSNSCDSSHSGNCGHQRRRWVSKRILRSLIINVLVFKRWSQLVKYNNKKSALLPLLNPSDTLPCRRCHTFFGGCTISPSLAVIFLLPISILAIGSGLLPLTTHLIFAVSWSYKIWEFSFRTIYWCFFCRRLPNTNIHTCTLHIP